MPGLAGKKALVKVTGAPLDFEDEECSTSDDQTYTIDDATKKYWDRDTAVQVFDDGVAVDPQTDPYRIIRLTGQVVFDSVNALRGPITVTGKYLPTSVAAGARAYSFELTQSILDDTTFDDLGSDDFARKIPGLKNVSGSISRRFRVESGMAAALIAGDPIILELYTDRAEAPDLVCWALLSKEGIQSAVDGTTDADVDWEGIPDADGVQIADTLA